MSNSPGIAVTAEPLPPSRAVVSRAPGRPTLPPPALTTETVAQRQGRPTRFQVRAAQPETDGSGAGKRPAQQLQKARAAAQHQTPRPSQAASAGFLAQVLAQAQDGKSESPLQHHRDGPDLGSSAYRRAGGEPPIYPEAATRFRLAV